MQLKCDWWAGNRGVIITFTVSSCSLGGEFGHYMTTTKPAERLNNWSQLASTGNMVRYVIENLVSLTGMVK